MVKQGYDLVALERKSVAPQVANWVLKVVVLPRNVASSDEAAGFLAKAHGRRRGDYETANAATGKYYVKGNFQSGERLKSLLIHDLVTADCRDAENGGTRAVLES